MQVLDKNNTGIEQIQSMGWPGSNNGDRAGANKKGCPDVKNDC